MSASAKQVLFWAPRALTVAAALFLGIFALDVFGAGYGFWQTLLALLIHLVPTFLALLVLAVAWRRPRFGGLLFLAAGAAYTVDNLEHPSWVLGVSGPLFLVGLLWILSGIWGERRPART